MEQPQATTSLGTLRGAWSDGVAVFRHVPYAAAPVGPLRFAPPAAVAAWQGIRDARANGPIAPQPPSRLRAAMGDFSDVQGEDCLSLTIWTPGPGRAAARPVLVWLHGGAYMTGGGSLDMYDGAALARQGDIVVVGVNYRLGACGFLHRPGFNEPNAALLDQQAALRWVADHIAGFGGDPATVTVMGQSAGGGSIAYLLTQPDARALFRRAILQSAALFPPLPAAEAGARAGRLCELLGIDVAQDDALERLRAVPIAQLLEAQGTLVREVASADPLGLPFCPTGNQPITQEDYIARIADGTAGKDVMIGWTREEMRAFYAPDPAMRQLDDAALARWSQKISGDPAAIAAYRTRQPNGTALDVLADFVTDQRFVRQSRHLAAAIAQRGGKAWTYRFDWSAPQNPFGACHCIELPFLFDAVERQRESAPMIAGGDAHEMAELGEALRKAWLGFVRNGDPGRPEWPAQGKDGAATLCFDRTIHLLD